MYRNIRLQTGSQTVSTCYGSVPRRVTTACHRNRKVRQAASTGENRLCVVCNKNCVETEKHFLLDCPFYDDLRLILFLQCSQFIEGFNCLNQDNKFIQIMNCDEIQPLLCKYVFDFYTRRILFLVQKLTFRMNLQLLYSF